MQLNFLVSNNQAIIAQFQKVLMERDTLVLLPALADLLRQTEADNPSLAIIDTSVNGYGDDGLKQIKQVHPSIKILLVGEQLSPMKELAALAAGAMGCCVPGLSEEQMHRIISIVEEGGVWISNLALPQLLERLRKRSVAVPPPVEIAPPVVSVNADPNRMAGLTHREREISEMVAEGLSNKVIARKLEISDRTVKAHLTAVFQKLNIHDRLQLALHVTKGGQ
jgi:two-component system nitrate/nitrite response regulator NarL